MLPRLGVSVSGYYAWLKRVPSKQEQRKLQIIERIKAIHEESYQIYGAPKIAVLLRREGLCISTRTVGVYMRECGIKAHYIRPHTITTKDCDFSSKLSNILQRDFAPKSPNAVWVTDITYVHTMSGFVYLTSIIDLFSRKVIAWDVSDSLAIASTIKVVHEALDYRFVDTPLIIHSDRGSQFISHEYKRITAGQTLSYSDKGTPWDNAVIEAFHAVIKREWLHRFVIRDLKHAHQLVFEFIHTFYNTHRIHGFCDYLSPDDFEFQFNRSIRYS